MGEGETIDYDYDSGRITGQKSDWIGTIIMLSSSIWLKIGSTLVWKWVKVVWWLWCLRSSQGRI